MGEWETGASGGVCRHICDVAGLSCAAGERGRENLKHGYERYHSVMVLVIYKRVLHAWIDIIVELLKGDLVDVKVFYNNYGWL
jgi:hypothetical protein